ncbi:MAG: hypothetical protein ACYDDC_00880 [Thermoplasmataceae archaeon]
MYNRKHRNAIDYNAIAALELVACIIFNAVAMYITYRYVNGGNAVELDPVTAMLLPHVSLFTLIFIHIIGLFLIFAFVAYIGDVYHLPQLAFYAFLALMIILAVDMVNDLDYVYIIGGF